jgi:transcriptional regulator with XRE-family HTH domain
MTKTEIAKATGKNLSFVSDLTYGRYGASAPTAKAIADALRCPLDMLFPQAAGYREPEPVAS